MNWPDAQTECRPTPPTEFFVSGNDLGEDLGGARGAGMTEQIGAATPIKIALNSLAATLRFAA